MSRKADPTLVGAFVVAAIALALAGVFVFGGGQLFRKKVDFVLFFEGDVGGLRIGSNVRLQGVDIGTVTDIRLQLVGEKVSTIPVTIAIDQTRLQDITGLEIDLADARRTKTAIEHGLRARLETESFVTGVRYISLTFDAESPIHMHGTLPDVQEIPTLPTKLAEFESSVDTFFKRLKETNIEGMVDDLVRTSSALRQLVESPGVQSVPASLERTLGNIDGLVGSLHAQVEPIAKSVADTSAAANRVAAELETVLQETRPALESLRATAERTQAVEDELGRTLVAVRRLVDPEAPLVVQLEATLAEFGATARSLRAVAEAIERDPSQLLRGKDTTR